MVYVKASPLSSKEEKMIQFHWLRKMVNFYIKLNRDQKAFFWLAVLAVVVYLALMPLYFFGLEKGYQYPNGWLFGSAVELFSYFTLIKTTRAVTKDPANRRLSLIVLTSLLRPLLYVVVLALSAICTFKSEWFGGFDMFSFWTSFAGLLPMPVVVLLTHFISIRTPMPIKKEDEK
ncbi:MAG TPA: hypothetical protein DDW18_01130 [Firmicutes bacterium]|nr:hypothetical protein [Bacillota bacterium]